MIFFHEKDPYKNKYEFIKQSKKIFHYFITVTYNITPIDGSCYKLINLSVQQEFFSFY